MLPVVSHALAQAALRAKVAPKLSEDRRDRHAGPSNREA